MFAYVAFSSMNSRRGPTSSPISMANIWSASAALSIVICFSVRFSGFMVVSHQLMVVHFSQTFVSLCVDLVFVTAAIFVDECLTLLVSPAIFFHFAFLHR